MDVDFLTFTGSTATGQRLMQYAGQSNLKGLMLECGGKSPQLVFDDLGDIEALANALGIADASVEGLRADVKKNLAREVKFRVQARNKAAVMEALARSADLELPKALIASELERLIESARADLKQRGVKEAETVALPEDIFKPQAERRVRLGLVVSELVRSNQLQARPEQLQAHIEEMSQSYEKPADVMRWYLGDRQRMAEVEAVVMQCPNVADVAVYAEKSPLTGQFVAARVNLVAPEPLDVFKKRLKTFCRDKLAPYKIPVRIELTDEQQFSARFKKMRKPSG
jgi:hypothetical protein